jgi:hypothetical protein
VVAGVLAWVLVELELEPPLAGAALEVLLLLLLPQPVATIAVASSATAASHPVRVVTVSSCK